MTDKIENPAAFPVDAIIKENDVIYRQEGMTLRDYFAALFVSALYNEGVQDGQINGYPTNWRGGVVVEAYQLADAMLKERVK